MGMGKERGVRNWELEWLMVRGLPLALQPGPPSQNPFRRARKEREVFMSLDPFLVVPAPVGWPFPHSPS